MSLMKKISRSDIDLPRKITLPEEESLPDYGFEFEFVEVDKNDERDQLNTAVVVEEEDDNKAEEDEYEFPLFNITTTSKLDVPTVAEISDADRGRIEQRVIQKISLRETSVERTPQTRPDSYYFSRLTPIQSRGIATCAISGDEIIRQSSIPMSDSHPWRVIDLQKLNEKISKDLISMTKVQQRKKQRLGKKKREEVIKSRERKLQRLKLERQLALELKKKLMKKIHHKRGGKKNKKKSTLVKPVSTNNKRS